VLRVQPQVERKERETETLVLLHVAKLVSPQPIGRLECEDDDVPEGDGRVMATSENEMREAAIAHIDEASVTKSRTREREPAERVPDRIGMVGDELASDAIARRRRPPSAPRRSGARA
jgi:hypothetical protein